MRRKGWHPKEESFLSENYSSKTIKELRVGLYELSGRMRSDDSINAKIRRMKQEGKISGEKDEETIDRSLRQRRKNI